MVSHSLLGPFFMTQGRSALMLLLSIDVILLILWTSLDPVEAELLTHNVAGVGELELIECVGVGGLFSVTLIALKVSPFNDTLYLASNGFTQALLTVLGCYCSYKARNTNDMFAETEHIMIA